MKPQKILITGVYGAIGGAAYCRLSKQPELYDVFGADRRTDARGDLLPAFSPQIPKDRFLHGDISDLSFACEAVKGMDAVVHMAASAAPDSSWDKILNANVVGTYSVFEACRLAKISRVIHASSIMTVFGYYSREPYTAISQGRFKDIVLPLPIIDNTQPVWPTEPYSASKVWGEALGKAYSVTHGMSIISIRIGSVPPTNNPNSWGRACWGIWCSLPDITQLIEKCINAPASIRFDVFFGISKNRYCWVDINHAKVTVGYEPESSADCLVDYN